jgi:4-oxalocrotonate tautomerase
MPFVQIKLIEGVFSKEQKRDMLNKITDTMIDIEGENMRPFTHVTIEEVKSGDWAIGGKSMETSDVKAVAEGKAA